MKTGTRFLEGWIAKCPVKGWEDRAIKNKFHLVIDEKRMAYLRDKIPMVQIRQRWSLNNINSRPERVTSKKYELLIFNSEIFLSDGENVRRIPKGTKPNHIFDFIGPCGYLFVDVDV